MRPDERHETRPFLKIRRAYIDVLTAGQRKHLIHGLVLLDVTEARRHVHHDGPEPGPLSFTGWVLR